MRYALNTMRCRVCSMRHACPLNMLYGRRALCDFLLRGAVAQLGERQNRTLEVGGSTPLCSTKFLNLITAGGTFEADRQSS